MSNFEANPKDMKDLLVDTGRRVTELRTLCSQLRYKLQRSRATQIQLAYAMVKGVAVA